MYLGMYLDLEGRQWGIIRYTMVHVLGGIIRYTMVHVLGGGQWGIIRYTMVHVLGIIRYTMVHVLGGGLFDSGMVGTVSRMLT